LSSGWRLSSVLLHWSFLPSLSWLVTELWRRLTLTFRTESLVICYCLLNQFSSVFVPEYKPVSWATLWTRICQCFRDSAWQFLHTGVNSHLIWEVRVFREPIFQAGLVLGPFSPP
jgi:hypothetical protein